MMDHRTAVHRFVTCGNKGDSRIHVIHQKNGGGGLARNQALNISRGEFVTFVDSDDYIAPIMFEFLLGQFQDGVDIVECDYCITENDHAKFDKKEDTYEYKDLFGRRRYV